MGQLLNPTFPKQKNANVVMVTICSVSITPSLFSRLLSELRIYGWQKLPPYFKKADYNLRSLQFFVKLIKTYYPCTCLAVFTKGLKKRTCFANFCNSNEVKQRWSLKPCLNKKKCRVYNFIFLGKLLTTLQSMLDSLSKVVLALANHDDLNHAPQEFPYSID